MTDLNIQPRPAPAMGSEIAVRIEKLNKWYGTFHVLRDIDLTVRRGERIVIAGPSGSGKSTLIRCINQLEEHQSGRITVDGIELTNDIKNIDKIRSEVGMVFQHFNLFPHMTALGNAMEAPVHVLGLPRDQARERAVEYLEMVGLGDKLDVYPAQLSGGQKQRVGIARALAMCPEIMLFDEVTSALDPELVGGILQILRDLSARKSMTMIIVTHQMKFAERSSDRTLFFDEGNIVEDAESQTLFSEPKEARTRQFLDSVIEGQ